MIKENKMLKNIIKTIHNNINLNSKKIEMEYSTLKSLLIVIYFISIIEKINLTNDYTILITIKGTGKQQILDITSGSFNIIPNEIYVNGELQNYNGCYVYDLKNEYNNITLKWNSNVTFIYTDHMFYKLENITAIDFIDFYTPNLMFANNMFEGCSNLISLNLNNMDTSKVNAMYSMFEGCSKITSLNLNNFFVSKAANLGKMFSNCESLAFLNLNNFALKNNDTVTVGILDSCNKNLVICLDASKASKIYEEYSKKYIKYKFDCNEICYKENIYLCYNFTNCPSEYKNLIQEKKLCVKKCDLDDLYKYEYNNKCFKKCPPKTNNTNYICNKFLCPFYHNYEQDGCINEIPQGFYLNSSDENTIDKCNSNCKTCNNTSIFCLSCYDYYFLNINNNNKCEKCQLGCKICKNYDNCELYDDDYTLINDKNNNKKCYEICEINYYFDESGNYKCINSSLDKSGDGTNKEINESIKYYDAFIKDVENNLMSKDYKTTKIDNGEDEIIISEKTPKMKITISNTQNQNNNADKNISTINLEQCASLLRKFYNLSENEILYIQKIEVIQEGMKIPKIEYNIYGKLSGDYLKKLNTSVCRNTTIYLSLPLIISGNIDEYNSSSGYYNNICYIKTTESGADISLKDRKNEYINKAICQDDCELFNYNYSTTKANCSCQFKESSSSFADIKINKTKLYKNF